jgi:transcriptional regulator with XRE-family HTH domain
MLDDLKENPMNKPTPNNANDPEFGRRITLALSRCPQFIGDRGIVNQSEVARTFNVTHSAVSYWCKGQRYPMPEMGIHLCRTLGLSMTWLYFGIGPMELSSPLFSLFSYEQLIQVESFITKLKK